MKVRTFDMLTGEQIEGTLRGLTMSDLATIETDDGRVLVRHMSRCQYDRGELKEWFDKRTGA